jgi:arylsulfatase A-like enzyme
MKRDILLISKDILKPDYLSCYGGKKWKTPNIDSLAESGTIFKNYYTEAPSTAMALTSMFSGLHPYELKRTRYTEVEPFDQCPTLFDILNSKGYENHVIWGELFVPNAWRFSKVYSQNTTFHNLKNIDQVVGPHFTQGEKIESSKNANSIKIIVNEVNKTFANKSKPVFIWIHCPHVLVGRAGYGADIDLFDKLVGELMDSFPREGIYLTADHGHMDCIKGVTCYGFHVYEPAIKIPLITPNHFGQKEIADVISNVQLKNIILEHKIYPQEFIYSDTQYYLQQNRKLMIMKGDFKYIYNKRNKSEELYDLKYDPNENVNLLIESWYDRNRDNNYYLEEIHYYPRWEEAKEAYQELKSERYRIWKEGTKAQELLYKLNSILNKDIANFYGYFAKKKSKVTGRWNSMAQRLYYEK